MHAIDRLKRQAGAALLLAVIVASPAAAQEQSFSNRLAGHLSVGYAKLFATHAPSGSMSVGAGLDYPVAHSFRAGLDIGFDLLGTNSVERGSLAANVNYSEFDVAALVHWMPRLGPLERMSVGPAFVSARAELSTAGGGAAFSDLAVEQSAGGVVADVTFMQGPGKPVRLGLEAGVRKAWLRDTDWTVGTVRLTVHY